MMHLKTAGVLLTSLFLSFGQQVSAQFYRAGDIVQDFVLPEHGTGNLRALSDFDGKIVILEWFTYW